MLIGVPSDISRHKCPHSAAARPSRRSNNAIAAGYVLQYVDSWVSKEWIVWPNQPPPGCPFAPSADLLDYEYTPAPAVPQGIGADTW